MILLVGMVTTKGMSGVPGGGFVAGVQWHPEFFDVSDPTLLDNGPILQQFLDHAAGRRRLDTRTPA